MTDNLTPDPASWDWSEWEGIELADGSHALATVKNGKVRLAVQDIDGHEATITLGSATAKAVSGALEQASIDAFRAEHSAWRTPATEPPQPSTPPASATDRRDTANVVGIRLAGSPLNVAEVLALLGELGFDIDYGTTTPAAQPDCVHLNAMITPSPDRPGRWLRRTEGMNR